MLGYVLVGLGIIGLVVAFIWGWWLILGIFGASADWLAQLYPLAWLRWRLGRGWKPGRLLGLSEEDLEPWVNPDSAWKVNVKRRVSACDNRPGLKKIYVTVLDENGRPLRGVKVHFETEPSEGIAYDHMNIWGLTDENGYIEWDHLGKPTSYVLWVGDEEAPLVKNIRTDLGNEYCKPLGSAWWTGNVPVNRPGIYSYWFEIQAKGSADVPGLQPVIISDVAIQVIKGEGKEGYAEVIVSFTTDVTTEAQVHYALPTLGGPDEVVGCDPWGGSISWRSPVSGPAIHHVVVLSGGSLWWTDETRKEFCLGISAWRPGFSWAKTRSEIFSLTL